MLIAAIALALAVVFIGSHQGPTSDSVFQRPAYSLNQPDCVDLSRTDVYCTVDE